MGAFFIDTQTGRVATADGLAEAGVVATGEEPALPWHRISAPDDASTMWYAVLRRQERGIFLGTMVFRHGDHHASLLEAGWEEIPVAEILGTPGESRPGQPM
ncbi:MAG: hypothetical protein ACKOB9_08780 [Solirubrobacterales bacterium]